MNIDWNLVILCALAVIAILSIIFLLVWAIAQDYERLVAHEQDDWTDITPDEYRALVGTASVLLRYKDETGVTCMHTCHKCNVASVIRDLQERGCSNIHILKLGR